MSTEIDECDGTRYFSLMQCNPEIAAAVLIKFRNGQQIGLITDGNRHMKFILLNIENELAYFILIR